MHPHYWKLNLIALLVGGLMFMGCTTNRLPTPSQGHFVGQSKVGMGGDEKFYARTTPFPVSNLIQWDRFDSFESIESPDGTQRVLLSPLVWTDQPWIEAIPSWNLERTASVRIELQALGLGWTSAWYQLGSWSLQTHQVARTSVRHQSDAHAVVHTDTLVLKQPGNAIRVRVTLSSEKDSHRSELKLLTLALSFSELSKPPIPGTTPFRSLTPSTSFPGNNPTVGSPPGSPLLVPLISQTTHPEGLRSWCSPASVAMVLNWWAQELDRPDLAVDLESTARQVYDPAWPGTGNWSFNTAYVGSFPELSSCVARLSSLEELERWTSTGHPIAVSVSNSLLKGETKRRAADGHIVVVTGFTEAGDIFLNDPGVRPDRAKKIIVREQFARSWADSKNTVYLTWPNRSGIDR